LDVATGGAATQAERTSALVFVGSRVGQLAFSALMIANDRRRFANPRGQLAILAAMGVESAWLTRRIVRAGRYDDRFAMWADTGSSAAALLLSHRGLASSAAPWAKNLAIGSAIGASSSTRPADSVGAVGLLCSAALLVGTRSSGRDAHVAGFALAANDALSWTGMSTASRVYLSAHRRYARERDQADSLAVDRSVAAGAQAERGRQHEVLHRVTIGVLRRIASTEDLAETQSIARAEAARLRYALRTEGRLPQGLDEALTELAEQAMSAGQQVDLVTAELGADPGPRAVSALRSAIHCALTAARELGAAPSVVVRAYTDDDSVRVSVRDHGVGFDPAAGGEYAARLAGIGPMLEPLGGTVRVRSERGEGVRVDLVVRSGGDAGVDDAQHGGPDDWIGTRAARDDEDPVVERYVQLGGREGPHATQDEVGLDRAGDLDAGVPGNALKTGAQQRTIRGDESSERAGHGSTIPERPRPRVGSSAQFRDLPADETRRAYRTMLAAVLTWRATGLATGAAALVAGGGRYRSRPIAALQLGLGVVESAWLARRLSRLDRWSDPLGSAVDAATAIGLLAMGQRNLSRADRVTWINWAPWSFAASAISGQAMADHPAARRIGGAAAIIAAHARQGPTAGDALANTAAQVGFGVGGRFLATQIRVGAVRLEQARATAVEQGRVLAQAREQAVQLRLLHDSAVQTLEAISGGRYTDLASIQVRARSEADTLERELDRAAAPASLPDLLLSIVAEHRSRNLVVDVAVPELPPLPDSVSQAVSAACHEALTNVGKHAGTAEAQVHVRAKGIGVILVIEDRGVGFAADSTYGGFGMTHSIVGRLAEVGGSATVTSRPGEGTRVELRWPA
jgi:signal transduction histidine kinase